MLKRIEKIKGLCVFGDEASFLPTPHISPTFTWLNKLSNSTGDIVLKLHTLLNTGRFFAQ